MSKPKSSVAVGRCLFFVDVPCSFVTVKTQGFVMPVCEVCKYFREFQEANELTWLRPQRLPEQVVKGECLFLFGIACSFVVGDEFKDWKAVREGRKPLEKAECRECSHYKRFLDDLRKEEEFLGEG